MSAAALGCEFYDNGDRPAFIYYRRAENGSKIEVKPRSDPNHLCYFPDASCEDANFSCCRLTDEMYSLANHGAAVNMYSCLVCLLLPMLCMRLIQRLWSTWQGQKDLDDEPDGNANVNSEEEQEEPEEEVGGLDITCHDDDSDDEEPSRCRKVMGVLTCVGFSLAIACECFLITFSASITQRLLSVPMRNSMLAGDAFLVPLREIFQFLEDVVTVKVMAAVGSGAVGAVRPVLQLGVFGGAFFGIVAAGCATALCSWPAALRWLLAPYAMHDSALGCSLVPKGDDAADMAKQYLLLSVWCWPALFVSMALKGFLLGLQEYGTFIFMGLVQTVTQIALLYILFIPDPSLDALGWIVFVGSYMSLISTLVIFCFKRELRMRYNLMINCAEATELGAPEVTQISWRKASQEGFYAMLLDIAAQASVTTGIYVAGAMLGVGAMYQVSAWQAAFPQYGLQWIFGVTYVLRLQGSRLVAAKEYKQFRNLFRSMVLYGIVLAIIAAASLIPFRVPIAFQQAAQACEYASSLSCSNIFASVFGGGTADGQDTLQGSGMLLFVPTLIARSFYQLYKAGLYAALDWSFMAKMAVASMSMVFLPAICIAIYLRTVSSILIAMYLPMLAMALAFILRTRRNIKRMLAGARGPWDKEL